MPHPMQGASLSSNRHQFGGRNTRRNAERFHLCLLLPYGVSRSAIQGVLTSRLALGGGPASEIGIAPAFAYWASTTRGSFVIAVRVDRAAGMPRAAVLSTVTRHLCLGDDFFPYVFWFSRWWLRQYGVLRWDSPTPGTSMPGLASGVLRALLKSGRLGGLP